MRTACTSRARTHALTHTHYSYTQAGKHVRTYAHTHARTHATLGGVISTASERVFAQREALLRQRAREFIRYLFLFFLFFFYFSARSYSASNPREFPSFVDSNLIPELLPCNLCNCRSVKSRVFRYRKKRENRSRLIYFSPPRSKFDTEEKAHTCKWIEARCRRASLSLSLSLSLSVLAICDTCA